MKKICLLFCGGTIGMMRNKRGALSPSFSSKLLMEKIPDMKRVADVVVRPVMNIDSSNMTPKMWEKIAGMVQDMYSEFDGFVIVQGTDTLAFTASALSYAIQNLDKPIVFTGSQKPLSDIASDAPSNILNAFLVATKNIPEVCIVFGSKILRGVRSTKVSESYLDAFDSPMDEPIGTVTFEPNIESVYKKRSANPVFELEFDSSVIVIDITPGFSKEAFANIIRAKPHGIILRAYGPGNIPEILQSEIKKAVLQEIPVVILSQSFQGMTRMRLYEVGAQALHAGAIPGWDMTMESAVAKLMWILSQTKDLSKIAKAFSINYVNEVTVVH